MKCPDCNEELEFVDDSFDHEFGTEIIQYYYCNNCDREIEIEELDENDGTTKNKKTD